MPRASSWSYPKEHKLGFHGDDSPRWALVGPLVSENRVLQLVRPGLAGTQDGRPRQLPGKSLGRRRQTGFDGQTVPRNKAQGQTPHRGCLRWCLVVILFSFRKKIDSGYVYRVYGVLEGSSRTTFAGAHVVQGEGGYGVDRIFSSIQTTMWRWRVLEGRSRTTLAGAHVVQGEGGRSE